MSNKYIEKILRARVYDVAIETPLDRAVSLSQRLNNDVYLKREDLQPVFSFKLRGAYNKMSMLDQESRAKGVIAASAGNHAQGVALSANKLGIKALIVMPKTTPEIKVRSVRQRGARTVLFGDSYNDAYEHAVELAAENGMTFIHPYDDPDVIAGQGTIAVEILRQAKREIHAIFVPVGGGGLIAGIASYVKFVRPEIRVIGVEPDDADCLHRALKAKRRVIIKKVGIFADGVAVRQVGKEPFKVAHRYVDEVITVNTDEICAAIKDIFDDTRTIAEPAGALGVAAIKKYVGREKICNECLITIESGANINFDRLRYVAERSEVGEQREVLLAVTIPEQPGSFLKFCRTLGKRNITEFNYRYFDEKQAHIFAGVASGGEPAERQSLVDLLESKSFPVTDITDNELAKEHMRYMVGGHAPCLLNEVVYRFEFPERPGALMQFLAALSGRWNISLFHYRNHGAAYGRVLMGVQIPSGERKVFTKCLDALGFVYEDESDNVVYKLFSGGRENN